MSTNYKEIFLTAQWGIYFLIEANNTIFDGLKNSPDRSENPFAKSIYRSLAEENFFLSKDCNAEQE